MTTNWQPPTIPAPPVPEKRKNWFGRHTFLTGLLALVVIAVLAHAFTSGGDAPATTVSPAANGSNAATGASDATKTAAIGQAVRDGKFEFTVTKVRTGVASVGDQYLGQKAQGQFVLVTVTAKNIGDEAQLLADSSQKVRDAGGREFSADSAAAVYLKDNDVLFNQINPGNSVTGVLVFDMPKGAVPASIELHDSPFSGGVTVRLG